MQKAAVVAALFALVSINRGIYLQHVQAQEENDFAGSYPQDVLQIKARIRILVLFTNILYNAVL